MPRNLVIQLFGFIALAVNLVLDLVGLTRSAPRAAGVRTANDQALAATQVLSASQADTSARSAAGQVSSAQFVAGVLARATAILAAGADAFVSAACAIADRFATAFVAAPTAAVASKAHTLTGLHEPQLR